METPPLTIHLSMTSFLNCTTATQIYTLSYTTLFRSSDRRGFSGETRSASAGGVARARSPRAERRSEEHTSELQSLTNLVCRLLLEKKKRHHLLDQFDQRIDQAGIIFQLEIAIAFLEA